MGSLDTFIAAYSVGAVALWAGLSLYVLSIERRRARARALLAAAIDAIEAAPGAGRSPADRLDRVRPLLSRASRDLIMSAVAVPGIGFWDAVVKMPPDVVVPAF